MKQLWNNSLQIDTRQWQDIPGSTSEHVSARVHAAGTVFDIDEGNDTFMVKVWQYIFRVLHLAPLTIHAMICVPNGFLWSYQPLPPLGSLITFTGDLLTVENGMASVGVDDHSYFVEDEVQMFEELDNLMS